MVLHSVPSTTYQTSIHSNIHPLTPPLLQNLRKTDSNVKQRRQDKHKNCTTLLFLLRCQTNNGLSFPLPCNQYQFSLPAAAAGRVSQSVCMSVSRRKRAGSLFIAM
ncbi:hypothetical protein ILYODFUR_029754 [Ilyodon furcidens]|uniref:Uncharacterized protein n=1 Tax=Ilyodon furcidens TaxID=33524 RepID=A0ABV0TEL4_9TELE